MWTLVLTLVFYNGIVESKSFGEFNSKEECLQYVGEARNVATSILNEHEEWKEYLAYSKIHCTQDVYFK